MKASPRGHMELTSFLCNEQKRGGISWSRRNEWWSVRGPHSRKPTKGVCNGATVPIPSVGGGRGVPRNLLGILVNRDEQSMCKMSPRALHHVVGMLQFMSDIHRPSLPTTFYSALGIYFRLYGPFNRISFPNFSRQLSSFSFCSAGLISTALFVLSTIYTSFWKSP